MTMRGGLGKVKGADPEQFIYSAIDIERADRGRMTFLSEAELRTALKEEGRTEDEIDSIIAEARKHEV